MPLTDVRIPNASADVVAVFDQDFNQVFEQARPIKCAVNEDSQVMEHPLEDSSTIADHQVFLPVTIELSMILTRNNYRSIYQQVKQLFRSSSLLIVQTRADSYANMLIQKMPHDEDPELFDVIPLALSLRQADFITPQYGTLSSSQVQNPADAATIDKGEQQSRASTEQSPSILYSIFRG